MLAGTVLSRECANTYYLEILNLVITGLKMKELEDVFKGVASLRRINILRTLFSHKELNVGEIADQIGLSFRSTSKHLIKLEKSGYLRSRQEGFFRVYWLNPKPSRTVERVIKLICSYQP